MDSGQLERCNRNLLMGLLVAVSPWGIEAIYAGDTFAAVDVSQVKVEGEIGRRIDATLHKNVLVLDIDHAFLKPFKERNREGRYIGLGKFIDSLIRFAAYTNDAQVVSRKRRLIEELIHTQEADAYIGMLASDKRMWALWDVHEMSYIVYAVVMDQRYFDEEGIPGSGAEVGRLHGGPLVSRTRPQVKRRVDRGKLGGAWFRASSAGTPSGDGRATVLGLLSATPQAEPLGSADRRGTERADRGPCLCVLL